MKYFLISLLIFFHLKTLAQAGENLVTLQSRLDAFTISDDGSNLILGDGNIMMSLWSIEKAEITKSIALGSTSSGLFHEIKSVNDKIISVHTKNGIQVISRSTGQIQKQVRVANNFSAAISNDGSKVITASPVLIDYWDIGTSTSVDKFWVTGVGSIRSLDFSGDDSKIICGTRNGFIQVFDVASHDTLFNQQVHQDWVEACFIDLESQEIISADRKGIIKITDLKSGKERRSINAGEGIDLTLAMDISKDFIAIGFSGSSSVGKEEGLKIYNRSNGGEVLNVQKASLTKVSPKSVTAFGYPRNLQFRGEQLYFDFKNSVWSLNMPEVLKNGWEIKSQEEIAAAQPREKVFTVSKLEESLTTRSNSEQYELRVNAGHTREIVNYTMDPSEEFIVTSSRDGSFRLWSLQTGRELRNLFSEGYSGEYIKWMKLFSSHKLLTLIGPSLTLWNTITGEMIDEIKLEDYVNELIRVDVTEDLKYLVGRELGTGPIRVWSIESGELIFSFQVDFGSVETVRFLKEGSMLAVGSRDGYLAVYDYLKGQQLWKEKIFEEWVLELTGDKNLFVVSSQGLIKKLRISDGKHIAEINAGDDVKLSDASMLLHNDILFYCARGSNRDAKQEIRGWNKSTFGEEISIPFKEFDFSAVGGAGNLRDTPDNFSISEDGKKLRFGYKYAVCELDLETLRTEVLLKSKSGTISNLLALDKENPYLFYQVDDRLVRFSMADLSFLQSSNSSGGFKIAKSADYTRFTTGYTVFDQDFEIKDRMPGYALMGSVAISRDNAQLIFGAQSYFGRGGITAYDLIADEVISEHFDGKGVYSLAVSPDNSQYISGNYPKGNLSVWDMSNHSKIRDINLPVDFNMISEARFQYFAGQGVYSPTGGKIAAASPNSKLYMLDAQTFKPEYSLQVGAKTEDILFSKDATRLVVNSSRGLQVWDLSSRKLQHKFPRQDGHSPNSIDLSYDEKYLFAGYPNGAVILWDFDLKEANPLLTIQGLKNSKDWFISTDIGESGNKYFAASKNAAKDVYYVNGMKTYGFDQFDLLYNRPDKVLKKLGYAKTETIKAFENAYVKRLRKMGFSNSRMAQYINYKGIDKLGAPLIELDSSINQYTETEETNITIRAKASDPNGYSLDRLMVSVNDVPLYGSRGRVLDVPSGSDWSDELKINLTPGRNVIGIKVLNDQGVFSFEELIEVQCLADFEKPSLYLIAIGASKYDDSRFDLTYAEKDAQDLAALLKSNDQYEKVELLSFINEDATSENILEIQEQLLSTKPYDHVVVFYAGHGLLDQNYDYFLSMHDMDFNNPASRGLAYENLESLVDGIPARNKVLLIDACHSGEVDKDEIQRASTQVEKMPNLTFRGDFQGYTTKSNELGLSNSFELMKQLFNDVRSGTGSEVISSAGGVEFALESDQWKNGVFTYSLLYGISSRAADMNADGKVYISELKDYIFDRVVELTNGMQNPTSRKENLENDFVIWKY